jgi:hypothetical protein
MNVPQKQKTSLELPFLTLAGTGRVMDHDSCGVLMVVSDGECRGGTCACCGGDVAVTWQPCSSLSQVWPAVRHVAAQPQKFHGCNAEENCREW